MNINEREISKVVDINVNVGERVENNQNLHKACIKIICYFSTDTIEDFHDGCKEYSKFKCIKSLIQRRMNVAINNNCDDAYQKDNVKNSIAHSLGIFIGLKTSATIWYYVGDSNPATTHHPHYYY
ncbi:hypothetical protein H8356DRAFT_1356259 [Neocallimastix lanati (nom. inval.)]|nr:hypothetical protein H8356DRAFT_1356259 [Neocallimastix sp. JGI-2020a]